MALKEIFTGSIDLSLIDKNRIKTVTKNDGSTAKYYDIQLFVNDEPDQYNNIASIAANQTKQESEAKEKKTYLGNMKRTFGAKVATKSPGEMPVNNNQDSDSLPF